MKISLVSKANTMAGTITALTESALCDEIINLSSDDLLVFRETIYAASAGLSVRLNHQMVRKIPDRGADAVEVKRLWDDFVSSYSYTLEHYLGVNDEQSPGHSAYMSLKSHLLEIQTRINAEQPV